MEVNATCLSAFLWTVGVEVQSTNVSIALADVLQLEFMQLKKNLKKIYLLTRLESSSPFKKESVIKPLDDIIGI